MPFDCLRTGCCAHILPCCVLYQVQHAAAAGWVQHAALQHVAHMPCLLLMTLGLLMRQQLDQCSTAALSMLKQQQLAQCGL